MKIRDYPDYLQNALAAHQGFRRLGFSRDDIFLVIGKDETFSRMVFLSLRTQGLDFNVALGPPDRSDSEVGSMWEELAKLVSSATEGSDTWNDLFDLWESSVIYAHPVEFIDALLARGFTIPKFTN